MASPQPPGDPNRPGGSGDGPGNHGPASGKAELNRSGSAAPQQASNSDQMGIVSRHIS